MPSLEEVHYCEFSRFLTGKKHIPAVISTWNKNTPVIFCTLKYNCMESFDHLAQEDRLKAENEFLKMKLMLEHGGTFGVYENNELPSEIENEFLNNMIAFEKQFEERKTIRVFDKIGRPLHFKPVNEIADRSMDEAWKELRAWLNEYGIDLDACSPNVSSRELYRFTIEELFELETHDMDLPGWTSNFIYDEFYPDPVYDNSRIVKDDLFREIFRKEEIFSEYSFVKSEILFNDKTYENYDALKTMISRFQSAFDEISLEECNVTSCEVEKTACIVKGKYQANAKTGNDEMFFKGKFSVELLLSDLGYWDMKKIDIENLLF
jgi:hypothetical protein